MNSEKDLFYSYLFEEELSKDTLQHECIFKKCCKKYKKPGKKQCRKCPEL